MNASYVHGFVSEKMCIGSIGPIPKNKRKSISDSNTYRSITLSSIFGKMFDIFSCEIKCANHLIHILN